MYWRYNLFLREYYITFYPFFPYFSGLKLNLRKSEIAGIEILNRVQVAVCGMQLNRSKQQYSKNISYSVFLQQKIERGKKFLWDCNRYSMSTENAENERHNYF